MVTNYVISNKNFNKIFGIGFNKTGTTTLEKILQCYGYKMPNQQEQESRLTKQTYQTNYSELKDFCSRFDAFQDLPFSQGFTFIVADSLFPNSKFILTERDSESWYNSMKTYYLRNYLDNISKPICEKDVKGKYKYLYSGYLDISNEYLLTTFEGNQKKVCWDKFFDKDYYISAYEQRNQDVKKYFASSPQKLLVIDITKEEDTSKICDFLNIPEQFIFETIHENQTSKPSRPIYD